MESPFPVVGQGCIIMLFFFPMVCFLDFVFLHVVGRTGALNLSEITLPEKNSACGPRKTSNSWVSFFFQYSESIFRSIWSKFRRWRRFSNSNFFLRFFFLTNSGFYQRGRMNQELKLGRWDRRELIVGHARLPWFYIFPGLCHTHTIVESIKRQWAFF